MLVEIDRVAAEAGTDVDSIWEFAEALYSDLLERVTDNPCKGDCERADMERACKLAIAWMSPLEERRKASLEWLSRRATACSSGPAVVGWRPSSDFAVTTDLRFPSPLDSDWQWVRDIVAGCHSIDTSKGGGCLPRPVQGRALKFFNPRDAWAPVNASVLKSLVRAGVLDVLAVSTEGETFLSRSHTEEVATALHHGITIRGLASALECTPSFCIELVEDGVLPVPLLNRLPSKFWRFREKDVIQLRTLSRRAKDCLSWDPWEDRDLVPVYEIMKRIRPMSPRQRSRSLSKLWTYGWVRLANVDFKIPLMRVGLSEEAARHVIKPW